MASPTRIGAATAVRLAQDGHDIAVAYRSDAQAAERVAADVRALGARAVTFAGDMSELDAPAALVSAVEHDIGPVEILIANAGINDPMEQDPRKIDAAVWDRMMAINVRGTWLTVRAIGPLMRDGGAIVTVSSDTIYWGAPKLLHYVTSKSALVGMTRSLARELGSRMIRVNCLLPGLTMGEATKEIPQTRWNDYAERTILKRTQQPDDLDGAVAFLLSDDAKFITGQTLAVDGGFSLH